MNAPWNKLPLSHLHRPETIESDLALSKWFPAAMSNCVLDVHKPQRNPIFLIVVALLKNINFFRAFTASSTTPTIYIQHFWDTMCFNSSTELYSCQLDEQWFNLYKDILRDALDITLANDNNPFVALPSSDTVIKYVNTLGYPRPETPLAFIYLWGINPRSTSTMQKDLGEDFVQSITYFSMGEGGEWDKWLSHCSEESSYGCTWKEEDLSSVDSKRRVHQTNHPSPENKLGMPWYLRYSTLMRLKDHPTYGEYQEHVAKYQQFMDAECGKAKEGGATESSKATKVSKPKAAKVTKPAGDKEPNPTATQPPKPKPAPTQPSKAVLEKKRKMVKETPDEPSPAKRSKGELVGKRRKPKSALRLVDEPNDEGVLVEEPAYTNEEADLQRALELSLKEQAEQTQGPARPVVLREPDSGKYQLLPEVQGKGKEKVIEEQAAHNLLAF
ncbi:copia protein [Tanacetum coccineum]